MSVRLSRQLSGVTAWALPEWSEGPTGFETPAEASALVEATLQSSAGHAVPVLIETHRATLFQDPARALALVGEFPELRFTADLSHWYTGVELRPASVNYARTVDRGDGPDEEVDRWTQAVILWEIAERLASSR